MSLWNLKFKTGGNVSEKLHACATCEMCALIIGIAKLLPNLLGRHRSRASDPVTINMRTVPAREVLDEPTHWKHEPKFDEHLASSPRSGSDWRRVGHQTLVHVSNAMVRQALVCGSSVGRIRQLVQFSNVVNMIQHLMNNHVCNMNQSLGNIPPQVTFLPSPLFIKLWFMFATCLFSTRWFMLPRWKLQT